ncbi:hypothetical protein J7443_00335 [Tropicibacter sp. R15_0]|uniref:hypothetical protein n=1 Tax=Tropicibacter sp. R15_0 TaxID=2821101 RepID=UPI001ADA2CE7|nr:hypothetical protein [Tropicibacter sp. R15_0]MBO9463664.1 hypothetical protein [Tropicibacter sp. R15_0]
MSKISTFSRALCLASFAAYGPVVAMAVLPATPVIAAQTALESAIALHDAGRAGDKAATEQAVAAFLDLMKAEPGNAMAVAYLGSSYAITARDSRSVTDKVRFTNRGLRFLDQAVNMAPDDFTVRLIRASVAGNLPAMFGRSETAIEDGLALDKIFSAAQAPSMAPHMVGIYDMLADQAADQGDWVGKAAAARKLAGS